MNRLRILHLEDSADDAELLRLALKKSECDVVHAFNPSQYKAALEKLQFDAILVDNALPTFSGLAALDEALKKSPDVPVVFLSGNADENQIKKSLEAGAFDYIVKENMTHLLFTLERIKEYIRNKRKRN